MHKIAPFSCKGSIELFNLLNIHRTAVQYPASESTG